MDIQGQHQISAPPEQVWRDLHDPDVLKLCIPGCKRLDRVDAEHFECDITAKYGPVKATFKSKLTIEECSPPNSYVLAGEGRGRAAGFGKARARVQLAPRGDGTLLIYTAQFMVGGKLAQLGSRLIVATTRRLSDDFFSSFSARFDSLDAQATPLSTP